MDGVLPAGEGVLCSGGGLLPCVGACLYLCMGMGVAEIEDLAPADSQRGLTHWDEQSMACPRW